MEDALELTPPDVSGVARAGPFTLTPDGQTFAYSYIMTTSDLYVVRGVR